MKTEIDAWSKNFSRGKPVLITGGAGFVGANLASRLLSMGIPVIIYDNLSRPGADANLSGLATKYSDLLSIQTADVLDMESLEASVARAGRVFHFAAQVAVTRSLQNPKEDFETNLQGTFNLLEILRHLNDPPELIFTSTNKVYGSLEELSLKETDKRYLPQEDAINRRGISENRSLAFTSPYGCSKGAADQYVLDYAHSFGVPAIVFRMSCIYGPYQLGTEDQGWVAHFLIRALEGESITIFGDGKQVRDLLFADDLVNAFFLASRLFDRLSGQVFNIGGGPQNAVSLLELLHLLSAVTGPLPKIRFESWRCGDQKYYVSNTAKFQNATGWRPQTSVQDGIRRLYQWLVASTELRLSSQLRLRQIPQQIPQTLASLGAED